MKIDSHRFDTLLPIIRDRMAQSGVDNYAIVDGHLQIGTMLYAVDACGCGEDGCDGLRLRRVQSQLRSAAAGVALSRFPKRQ